MLAYKNDNNWLISIMTTKLFFKKQWIKNLGSFHHANYELIFSIATFIRVKYMVKMNKKKSYCSKIPQYEFYLSNLTI